VLDEEALQHVLVRERVRRMAVLGNHAQRAAERIDTLERRITKLRAALQDTERSLAELARRVELDTGVPSIYSEVQGLSAGDALREAKAAMLACVFEANLALQRRSG
jgi:predicted  nucleic acid-binding Zn-ribbon protein